MTIDADDVDWLETFTYDGLNRMLEAKKVIDEDPDPDTEISLVEFAYNDIGRITDFDQTHFGGTMRPTGFEYDQAGFLESTTYPDGSTTIDRTNDWRGRIGTLERSSTTLVDYAYIGPRVAQRSYGVPGVDYEPTYDNLGRVTSADYDASIVKFDYTYVDDENNIDRKTFDHRTDDPYNQYTYDDLDRLIDVDYLVNVTPDHEETFVMDTLGNRTGDQILTDGTVDFTVDSATNRYTSVGGNAITHDDAGNMTTDKDEYEYFYDYENRLVKIEDSSSVEVATHDYDALGRRIRVIDKSADPDVTTLYYYNPEWQVLAEYNGSNELQRYYVYGNYIDEPLVMSDGTDDYYYVQDHLYSTVALIGYVDSAWVVVERCEYDAYGKCAVLYTGADGEWFTSDDVSGNMSDLGNPYTFTGRRLDALDTGNFLTMHYRHRTYDTYTARFLQQDPMGYVDGINLYEYATSAPILYTDPTGEAVVVTVFFVGNMIRNGIIGLYAGCYCYKCVNMSIDLIRYARERMDADEYTTWFRTVKPVSQCGEICRIAGIHALKVAAWGAGKALVIRTNFYNAIVVE